MKPTDILTRSTNAAYQSVGEETILINLNTGEYYTLNDTGSRFWQLLDGQRTIADCAAVIAGEYDVPPAVVEADLLELAAEFVSEGLAVVSGGP
ncbi:MAG: PqqD family protein [Chloroflexi bacterium]|nr:MAG: PqqD family protein [Chloroflexota bacterium]